MSKYRYSILVISGQYYGVEVSNVREVLLMPSVTKVPNVHNSIKGVFNLRGQIYSVIDIRGLLNLPGANADEEFVVIVEFEKIAVGIAVEKVLDVFSIDSTSIQIPTRDMSLSLIHYTSGYYEHKKLGKIYLLDLSTLMNAKELASYNYQ